MATFFPLYGKPTRRVNASCLFDSQIKMERSTSRQVADFSAYIACLGNLHVFFTYKVIARSVLLITDEGSIFSPLAQYFLAMP